MKYLIHILSACLILPIMTDAQSPATFIERGNKAYALKNYTEAKQDFENAVKQDANKQFPEAHFNLANTFFHLGNFQSAVAEYQTFIASVSEKNLQSQAYYNIGTCFLSQKNFPESIDAFKKALQLNPKNEDARYNLSYAFKISSNQTTINSSVPNPTSNEKKNEPPSLPPLSPQEQQQLLNTLSQSEAKTMKNNFAKSNRSSLKKDW